MQSYSDLSLKCCDCDSTFTSATKLLQHFAEHVHQESKHKFKGTMAYKSRKKRRTGVEVSTSQGESGSESSQTLSVSDSCSESRESVTLEQPQPCKLAKFDLQKRLETCVSNITTQEETDIVGIKQEWNDEENPVSPPEAKVTEDYSPLKYCMITMEENDNKSDMISSNKKVPSRKQLLPKKIERKVDVFRKLAPKPEGLVSPEPSQSPGKKKYACHLCTKVFGWSTDLKRHILVHTGERPFKCKTCEATFTRNFLLQKHQSKVHPCKPKEAEIKPEIVEISNFVENNSECDVKAEVDPLKEEPMDENDIEDDDDDEDDDRLVITEDVEEKPSLTACSADTKWHLISANADRRCSDLKQSDLFSITPVKV